MLNSITFYDLAAKFKVQLNWSGWERGFGNIKFDKNGENKKVVFNIG